MGEGVGEGSSIFWLVRVATLSAKLVGCSKINSRNDKTSKVVISAALRVRRESGKRGDASGILGRRAGPVHRRGGAVNEKGEAPRCAIVLAWLCGVVVVVVQDKCLKRSIEQG